MVSEAHCMSCPSTELLLFNYANVKTVFHSMAPLIVSRAHIKVCIGFIFAKVLEAKNHPKYREKPKTY